MELLDYIKAYNSKISGGSPYYWESFGPNARYLDFESEFGNGSIVFDTVTQLVYQAEVMAKENPKPYRWLNPDYSEAYPNTAWDDVEFIDVIEESDLLEKASAIMSGKDFDQRIKINVELNKNDMYILMSKAHDLDIFCNH
jgi:hypothetical protein